jgi:DNA replication factor GINS
MYDELYAAWRREIEESTLGSLPPDFYARIANYLTQIIAENKQLDKKSVKASLLDHEALNVKQMLEELIWARYSKIVKTVTQNQKLPSEQLTIDEAKIFEPFAAFTEAYQKFSKNLLQGQAEKIDTQVASKRLVLRFVKNIPAIIGADMKTYGPFKIEDVASLPAENAKILIKQGLAMLVEVS